DERPSDVRTFRPSTFDLRPSTFDPSRRTAMRLDLLKRLCETPGIPGYEERIRRIVIPELREVADEVSTDALGNVVALKRGGGGGARRKVMLAAHMDEIGFMVSHVSDRGFL